MLTELNNKCVKASFRQVSNSVFSVQCGICKVVPVRAMQAFRGVEVQFHTYTLNLSMTVNGHEWSAACQAGWEPELARALWSKEISLPLPGIKL